MKKKLGIGMVILILLISLLPLPQKMERTFYGVHTLNGEHVDIALDMKYLKFLFLDDKLYGTITVRTETETFTYGKHLNYNGQTSFNQETGLVHNFSGWYYNDKFYMREYENGLVSKAQVGFEPCLVHISSDFNKILILHQSSGKIESQDKSRYVGTVNQNQLEETKQYFAGFYD